MRINKEKQFLIDKKLDALLERLKTEFSLDFFSEIFDLFDDKFEQEYPKHYIRELNPKYALENLLHPQLTSKQEFTKPHHN